MLTFALVLACSKPASPAGGVEPAPPSEAPAKPADAVNWIGTWTSPSCGERTYERRIELTADLRANVEERISPCPEGARCIWSGIVVFEGTYVATGNTVALSLGEPLGKPQGGPDLIDVPDSLTWKDGVAHQGSCAYTR